MGQVRPRRREGTCREPGRPQIGWGSVTGATADWQKMQCARVGPARSLFVAAVCAVCAVHRSAASVGRSPRATPFRRIPETRRRRELPDSLRRLPRVKSCGRSCGNATCWTGAGLFTRRFGASGAVQSPIQSAGSPPIHLLALNDRLVADLGTQWLYTYLRRAPAELRVEEVRNFIRRAGETGHPEVREWTEDTQLHVAQHYMASIRDFGSGARQEQEIESAPGAIRCTSKASRAGPAFGARQRP